MRHALILVLIVLCLHDGHAEEAGHRTSEDHAHEGSWALKSITMDSGLYLYKYANPCPAESAVSKIGEKTSISFSTEDAVKSFGGFGGLVNLVQSNPTMTITNESFEAKIEGAISIGSCIVDPKRSPKRMTIAIHKPGESEPPKKLFFIYELRNDSTMILCAIAEAGPDTFPESFSAPAPSGKKLHFSGPYLYYIFELQRLSSERLQEKKTD